MEIPWGRGLTVLCVGQFPPDDERICVLSRWAECTCVPNQAAALEVLAAGDVEAVLMDAMAVDLTPSPGSWLPPHVPLLALAEPEDARGPSAVGVMQRGSGEGVGEFMARVFLEMERRVLQASLDRGDGVLDQLIDCNPYAIAIHNRQGRQVRVNRAFVDWFGSATPPDFSIFDHETHREPAMEAHLDRLRRGETITCPPLWFNPHDLSPAGQDRRVCVRVVAFPLVEASGAMRYFVTLFENVTASMLAEQALVAAHRQLQEAHDELEARVLDRTRELEQEIARREGLQRRLMEKNRELEDFSFRVGHDVKNSLFAICSILEVGRADPSLLIGSADVVVTTTHRLIDFVERLLQMARAGRVIGQKETADLAGLLRRVFDRSRPAGCEVEFVVMEPMPPVLVDVPAVEQAVGKVLDNSFQHRDPERPLRIEAAASLLNDRVELRVRDNGRGILPQTLEGVFKMCFQTEEGERVGFGLPIVKKIVEAHGGTARAESQGRGCGAEIVIDLPAGRWSDGREG